MKQYTREMFQEETLKLTAYDKEKADKVKEGFGVFFDLPSSLVTRLSGWSKDDTVRVTPRAVFSFSSDHGIEEEGGLTDGFSLTTADMLRSLEQADAAGFMAAESIDWLYLPPQSPLRAALIPPGARPVLQTQTGSLYQWPPEARPD